MKNFAALLIALIFGMLYTLSANATLVDNGDGTLTSDASSLMWLQDANLAGTSMTWADAFTFVDNVNNGTVDDGTAYTDWRLAIGSDCNSRAAGANCDGTGSELADLYFEILYDHATLLSYGDSPFINGMGTYWTSTEWFGSDGASAMTVDFINGGQNDFLQTTSAYVMLVRDGGPIDPPINGVPEPSTLLMLGSGLLIVGIRRRYNKAV